MHHLSKIISLQDVAFFDDPLNSTGHLTARLAVDASAVNGVRYELFSLRLRLRMNVYELFIPSLCLLHVIYKNTAYKNIRLEKLKN